MTNQETRLIHIEEMGDKVIFHFNDHWSEMPITEWIQIRNFVILVQESFTKD